MSLKQIKVKISKKGNFYTDYKNCRIIVKLGNKGLYKGRIYKGDLNCRLVGSDNIRTIFQMAIDHIDENY